MKRLKGELGVLDGRVKRAAYMKPRPKFIGGKPGDLAMGYWLAKGISTVNFTQDGKISSIIPGPGGFVHVRCSKCGRPLITQGKLEDLDIDVYLCANCWQKFNEASPIDPEIKSLNIDSGIPPRNSEIGTREPRPKKSKVRRIA